MTMLLIYMFVSVAQGMGNLCAEMAGTIFDVCAHIEAWAGITIVFSRMTSVFISKPPNIQKTRRTHSSSKVFYISRPRHARRRSTTGHKSSQHRPTRQNAWAYVTTPIITNATTANPTTTPSDGMSFDTDAFPIAIDSGSTFCLTDHRSDFEGPLTQVDIRIQGISDKKGAAKWKGTAVWNIQDDDGRTHKLHIPNTLLVDAKLPSFPRNISPKRINGRPLTNCHTAPA